MSETRPTASLRSHPENAAIFGDPEESEQFDAILASVRKHGIWEPLAIKADGTILSGHLRLRVAERLKLREVPVRVVSPFASYREEVTFLIRSNTDRRQLTKAEIAIAFKRLRELPPEQGGVKGKRGPKSAEQNRALADGISSASGRISRADEEAASALGIGKHEGYALQEVFTTPGVPAELKAAVERDRIAPTTAAKAVKAEVKRQGGAIKDPSALRAVAAPPPPPERPKPADDHAARVAAEAKRYEADYAALFNVYKKADEILSRRPLKAVIGPTEHHQYRELIRDLALRAWREIEAVSGPTSAGKQMALSVIEGGRS